MTSTIKDRPSLAPPRESAGREFPRRRWVLGILLAWAAVSTVLLLTTVSPFMPQAGIFAGGEDFDTYRVGGHFLLIGLPLYDGPLIHEHLYTYPPFSALAFLSFALLPHVWDKYIWMATNLGMLIAIVALCWRILGYRITPYVLGASTLLALACTFLEPVRTTLFYGQINLVLLLIVLWDTSRGDRSRLKGIGVGLAAGVKLTPLYFVLHYLSLRQWRAAGMALATFAATIALGWIVVPAESRLYWTGLMFHTDRIAGDLLHPSNQSLRGAMARLTGGPPSYALDPMPGEPPPTWLWLTTAACVVVVSACVAVLLYRGGERLLAVIVTGLTGVVVSPFSWCHHWVWFVPLIVYIVHRALTNRWWWLCAAALFAATAAWPYWFPIDTVPRIGLYMFPATWVKWHVVANTYLVVYAATMIGAAAIAIQVTRKRLRANKFKAAPASTIGPPVESIPRPPVERAVSRG